MRTSALLLVGALPATLAHLQHGRRAASSARTAAPVALAAAAASTAATSSVARDTWEEEATVPIDEERVAYSLPVVAAISATYPAVWETADLSGSGILQDDKDLWATLNATINSTLLAIPPRGTREGNFTGVDYDGVTDADCWWSWKMCDTPDEATGLVPDITRCNEPSTWGFTLDDGPNATHNAYYDYLKSIDQKATLFYIGSNVLDWPLEAQRGLGDGHELCAHTWSHPYMTAMTNEQAFAELYYSKKVIKEITGVTVRCWRPPYGDVDNRIRAIAAALDMTTIVWDEDTDDWEWTTLGIPQIEANYEAIIGAFATGNYSTHGTIVLSHELNNETMVLSEKYLPIIKKTFTGGVMPVGVCMNNTQPYLEQDNQYVYPNYAQWVAGTTSISLAAPTATTSVSIGLSATATATSAGAYAVSKTEATGSAASAALSSASAKATASTSKTASSGGARGSTAAAWTGVLGAAMIAAVGVMMA
ncbi:hypothetical protein BCR35DRAFT_300045 [Leucosporidium creatinivorum]|uniref:chitin deacetylase n=1 Tax=Leucosporidium creatinivorum TaxID=106004 RepID=A0A1Y2FZP2_9BASI|nr:hypothetical protein BCR35DRAFT_300045 [Leucosporidium creatinivorum]